MSQSIETYFLCYKGGSGYVLDRIRSSRSQSTNPLPPSISTPAREWTVV